MSTAQSARPDESDPVAGTPEGPAPAPGRWAGLPRWGRRAAVGLVTGALAWCLAALLGPDAALWRQAVAAVLCAGAAPAVQHLTGPDPRTRERSRRAEHLLAETAATVRDGLRRHDDVLRDGLRHHDDVLRDGLRHHDDALRDGLRRHDDALRTGLTRHAEDMRQLVESRLTETDRVAPAPPRPERARIDSVPELAKGFAEVLAPGPPILFTFVRLELKRVVGHMTELTSLSAECAGENHDWMLSLTRAAERSICATSTSVDREFWNSEPASRYLQAQHEAIAERGVPVRRLFLLESARELDDRLLRLCEEQELLGIEVRVSVLPELPPHLQRGTTNDFIVYDEEVSFEIDQDLRDVNVRTRLIARQGHVQDRMKRFRELWEAGMSLRELEVRVDDEEDGTWMVDRG
ncbi:hypothetical protein ABZ858_29125 [Streptomyces sp. NPDC047017]|uniref:hypothetical protein n=1 Tax=Streptomyces sp. NPDC047017 TaxID=3155024 RepID=UPI0033F0234E